MRMKDLEGHRAMQDLVSKASLVFLGGVGNSRLPMLPF